MAIKPAQLIYGVDDKPPLLITLFLGLQHLCIFSISLTLPVMLVREMGGSHHQAGFLVSMTMLAAGVGAILQSLKKGPVGSGYLCPQVCGPSFFSASLMAAHMGGLPLVLGMTAVAGVTESIFSRFLHRLRVLFPAEVTGVIVAMVGITVIKYVVPRFMGLDQPSQVLEFRALGVALLTLATIVGLNIWSKGKLRLFCVLVGMVVGYVASWFLGLLTPADFGHLAESPIFSLPAMDHPGWSFDLDLLIPVVVATLCSSLKTVGDLTTCQKANDSGWVRPDLQNIKKGILADGLGCLTAGLVGGMGQSSSSSNIGLSIGTGATSRVIGLTMGCMLITLSLFPRTAAMFAIMPSPVMGASLVFSLSFMVVAGLQIIMSRMLDARKTFTVGISIIVGLSVDMLPGAFDDLHHWLRPIFSSSLSAAAVTAVLMNLLFRLGVASTATLTLTPGEHASKAVSDFMDLHGRAWGARKEVIDKAAVAMNELWETVREHHLSEGPMNITVRFDELRLDVMAEYSGRPMVFADRPPSEEDLLLDPDAVARLSSYLVSQYVDKLSSGCKDGRCKISLRFQH